MSISFSRVFFITFHLLLLSGMLSGQISNLTPGNPSPGSGNIGALESKYGVNHINGALNFSVPLMTVQSNNVSVPISLNYIAGSGVPTNMIASEVGLGWNLSKGGFVSREVRGLPDDVYRKSYPQPGADPKYYNVGRLYRIGFNEAYYDEPIGELDESTKNKIKNGAVDTEPDIFHFSIQGISGSFVFEDGVVKLLSESEIKVEYDLDRSFEYDEYYGIEDENIHWGSQGAITSFIITLPNGNKYTLDTKSISIVNGNNESESVSQSPCHFNSIYNGITQCCFGQYFKTFKEGTNIYVDTWHVSKIGSVVDDNEVSFIYEKEVTYDHSNLTQRYTDAVLYKYQGVSSWGCDTDPSGFTNSVRHLKLGWRTKRINFKKGSGFPSDQYVRFVYATSPRTDFYYPTGVEEIPWISSSMKAKRLLNIRWINNNTVYKQVSFNTNMKDGGYVTPGVDCESGSSFPDPWTQGDFANAHDKRLILRNVEFKGRNGMTLPKLKFHYFEGKNMPPRHVLTTDLWGYYNDISLSDLESNASTPTMYWYPDDTDHNHSLRSEFSIYQRSNYDGDEIMVAGLNKMPNLEFARTNMLQKVTFPNGSQTEFDYDLNSAVFLGQEVPAGGLRITNISSSLQPNKQYEYVDNAESSSGVLIDLPNCASLVDYVECTSFQHPGPTVHDYMVFSSSVKELDGKGLNVVYSHVKEVIGGYGYTITEFDPIADVFTEGLNCSGSSCMYDKVTLEMEDNSDPDFSFFGMPSNPNLNWMRAAPSKSTTFNADGSPVKETEYYYETYGYDKIEGVRYMDFIKNDISQLNEYELKAAAKYFLLSGDRRIKRIETTEYLLGGTIENTVNYEYDSNEKHRFPIETWYINSDGKKISEEYVYVYDIAPVINVSPNYSSCESEYSDCVLDCQYEQSPEQCESVCEEDFQECKDAAYEAAFEEAIASLTPENRALYRLVENCMGGTVIEQKSKIGGDVANGKKYEYSADYNSCPECLLPKKYYSYEADWVLRSEVLDYNNFGRPEEIATLNAHNGVYTWNSTNGKLSSVEFGNRITSYAYNVFSELDQKTTFDGFTTTYQYDNLGRVNKSIARNGNITNTYTYNIGAGNNSTEIETELSDSEVPKSIETYDLLGRTTSNTLEGYAFSGGDWTTSTTYDLLGRVTMTCDPAAGGCTKIDHEENKLLSLITTTTAPGWSKSVVSKSKTGQINGFPYKFYKTEITDENGNKIEEYRDRLGRIFLSRKYVEDIPFETSYEYDNRGRLKKVQQPNGTSFEYAYEWSNGWKQTKSIPGGGDRVSKMNLKGLLEFESDANGHTFNYYYDEFNQLDEVKKDGETIKNYTYNSFGRVEAESIALLSEGGTLGNLIRTYNYGTYHRLNYIEESALGVTLKTEFEDYDQRDIASTVKNIYSGNVSATFTHGYDYDIGERLNAFHINGDPIVDILYTDNDWVSARILGDNLSGISYGYNSRGWLTNINNINECHDGNGSYPGDISQNDDPLMLAGSLTVLYNADEMDNGPGTYVSFQYEMEMSNDAGLVFDIEEEIEVPLGFPTNFGGYTDTVQYQLLGGLPILEPGNTGGGSPSDIFLVNILPYDPGTNKPITPVWTTDDPFKIFTKKIDDFFINQIPSEEDCKEGNGLYAEEIHYDNAHPVVNAEEQYNGNVSFVRWNAVDRPTIGVYGMQYDGINRMTDANYVDKRVKPVGLQQPYINHDAYSVHIGSYDQNGNIQQLTRRGYLTDLTQNEIQSAPIDILSMSYQDNRMTSVTESGNTDLGYLNSGASSVGYDANGNRLVETEQGAVITYNYLDLPETIVEGNNKMSFVYDADGNKLRMSFGWGSESKDVIYIGNAEIVNNEIQSYYHADGRFFLNDDDELQQEYVISDHLGNNRVFFTDEDEDGSISLDPADEEVTQEAHYYPFGMKMDGNWVQARDPQSKYHFNGIEFPVSQLHMGFTTYRTADVGLGSWYQVDPYAESFYSMSSYCSMGNSPMLYSDHEGGWIHIAIGAVVGGVVNVVSHLDQIDNVGDGLLAFGIGAAGGALTAATGGAAVGAGFVPGFAIGAASGIAGDMVTQVGNVIAFNDQYDYKRTLIAGGVGGVLGGATGYYTVPQGVNPITGKSIQTTTELSDVAQNLAKVHAKTGIEIGDATIGTARSNVGNSNWWQSTNVVDDAARSSTATARSLGVAGERAVGIGSKTRIPSLTGTAKYRIPDGLSSTTLTEVKNVSSLSYTRQLRDFHMFSQQTGRQFMLYTRPTTTFSGPLQNLINQGQIIVRPIPGF